MSSELNYSTFILNEGNCMAGKGAVDRLTGYPIFLGTRYVKYINLGYIPVVATERYMPDRMLRGISTLSYLRSSS